MNLCHSYAYRISFSHTFVNMCANIYFMSEQRWLTLDMLCTVLRLQAAHIKTLAKKGFLVSIGGKGAVPTRYLEPTEEYKEQLRIAALLHMRAYPISTGITEKCLFTAGEIGAIIGKDSYQTSQWLGKKKKIPSYRINKTLHLYTVKDVRDLLLRRAGRVNSRQRAPFLIPQIVEYLRSSHAEDLKVVEIRN